MQINCKRCKKKFDKIRGRVFCCKDCAIAHNQKMAIDRNRRIKAEYKEEKRIKDENRKEYVKNYALNRKKK